MIWPAFKSETQFEVKGRGTVYVVSLYKDVYDFNDILGECLIDGQLMNVTAVERFAHMPPWREGEKIGLLAAPSTTSKEKE